MSKPIPVKVVYLVLLMLLLSFQLSHFHCVVHPPFDSRAKVAEDPVWQVYYEGRDKSAYRLNIGKYVSGLEIWLFISTNDSYAIQNESIFDNDYIELAFIGNPITVVTPQGQYTIESIVGLSKIGYEGDHEKSVGGLHGIYYVLPKSRFVSYVNITLYAAYSTPRLDMIRSFTREWDPIVDIVQLETWSKGWRIYNVTQDCRGRASIISFGLSEPMSSGLFWYFGKKICIPKLPSAYADVYVEVGYAGGINIAPEPPPYAGQAAYKCKINVGVCPGSDIRYAAASKYQETVYKSTKYPLGMVIEHAADGCIDIESAFLEKLASEVGSELMKEMLGVLDYITFVLDIIDQIKELEFDEKVAENKILVFKDFPVGESFIAFFSFYAETATLGLTGGIVNFWGECPFGQPLLDFAVDLEGDGGMQIGGILIDYHEERFPENLIFIREDGYVYPPTPLIVSDYSRIYRLIGDINTTLIVKRDNIILDGCGYTLKGGVVVAKYDGYERLSIENVTIASLKIEGGVGYPTLGYLIRVAGVWWGWVTGKPSSFIEEIYEWSGIILDRAVNIVVLDNTIIGCQVGITVLGGRNCTIIGNNIMNFGAQPGLIIDTWDMKKIDIESIGIGMGVILDYTEQATVSENAISLCEVGILIRSGTANIVLNQLVDNDFGVWADGVEETISHNYISRCRYGISNEDSWTNSSNIFENTILNCDSGISVWANRFAQISRNYIINCTESGIQARGPTVVYSPREATIRRDVSENKVLNCAQGIIVSGLINASENNVNNCIYGIIGYDGCIISRNSIANCAYAINASKSFSGEDVIVIENNVINCTYGITGSNGGNIGKNNLANCIYGIIINGPVTVNENKIVNCKYGITRTEDGVQGGIISGNSVMDCVYGISAISENRFIIGELITKNNISSCTYGIIAGEREVGNNVSENNVINCTYGITGGEHVRRNNVINCMQGIIGSHLSDIIGNNVVNCAYGITAPKETIVEENSIANCIYGITGGTYISRNKLANCAYGITGSGGGTVSENDIVGCANGIIVTEPIYPAIIGSNNITRCQKGILVKEKRDAIIRENNFIKNNFGIYIAAGLDTKYVSTEGIINIVLNNFIMNNVSIFVEDDNLRYVTIYVFNNNFIENGGAYGEPPQCIWSEALPIGGNYWSDYTGVDEKSGENQDQPGADGVGDKPYQISGKAVDRYPLMEPIGSLPSITIDYTIREGVITLTSNSAISNFRCNLESKIISFYVQGKSGTRGFVSINIPKSIIGREIEVLFDSKPIAFNKSETTDSININFAYKHTKHYVEIRFGLGGGIPPQLDIQNYNYIVFLITATGLLLLVLYMRKLKRAHLKPEPLPPPPLPPPPPPSPISHLSSPL